MIDRLKVGSLFFLSLFILHMWLYPISQVWAQSSSDLIKQAIQFTNEKKHEEAVQVFKKILSMEPNHSTALEGLGVNYFLLKKYKESQEALEGLLKLNPNSLTALLTLGKLFEEQDIYYKANYYYEKALKLDAYQLEAYWGKGRVFNKDRQYRNAIEIFKKGLNLDPYHKGILQGLAFAHRRLGDYAEAIDYEKKILELYPEDLETILRTADHYESLHNTKAAIFWYEKARKINPKDERIHVKLALLYSKADRIDEAATALQKAIELQEGNIDNYITLGRVYGWLSRLDEARGVFEKAVRIDPKNVDALNDLATVELFSGHWDKAEQRFNEALKILPKDKNALKGLEDVHIQKGPLFTSRVRFLRDHDNDHATEDRVSERREFSEEFIYHFSPSFFMEGRYQRNERYQDIVGGDREFKFKQDIGSLKFNAKMGKYFLMSGRGEINHFVNVERQLFNFKKDFDQISAYLYGLWEKEKFFGFGTVSRSLLLRRINPDHLRMEPFHSYGSSFGYSFTPAFQSVLRYSYIDFIGPHERHDLESTTTWRLPFFKQVELGYGFNWLSNPSSRIHSGSIQFQEQFFRSLLFELLYKLDFDDNKIDAGLVRAHHGRLLTSFPIYKKISLNLEAEVDVEDGRDDDLTQTYRAYLQIPLGIIF